MIFVFIKENGWVEGVWMVGIGRLKVVAGMDDGKYENI